MYRLTNRSHVAMHLFSNRSQITSKCAKSKKVAHKAIAKWVTDVLVKHKQSGYQWQREWGLHSISWWVYSWEKDRKRKKNERSLRKKIQMMRWELWCRESRSKVKRLQKYWKQCSTLITKFMEMLFEGQGGSKPDLSDLRLGTSCFIYNH